MQNVLILAPAGSPDSKETNASTLQAGLVKEGLKHENVIVRSGTPTTDDIVETANKRHVGKILAFGIPTGTLECIIKKMASLPKPPKVFCLHPQNENRQIAVKKGFLYLINCPKEILR